jgi:hypothetical protein
LDSFELLRLEIAEEDPPAPPQRGQPDWIARPDRLGGVWGYTRATAGAGWLYLPGIAVYEFETGTSRVKALRDGGATDDAVVDAYYRHALPMALDFHGFQVLHASAVRGARGVHVFSGTSHAGKSTLAYALRQRRYEVFADDAVAFTVAGGTAAALPLPFALRLRAEAAEFFDGQDLPGSSGNGRVDVLRYDATEPLPVASVSLLDRGAATTRRLTPSESFPALLSNGFYFSPEDEATRRRITAALLTLIADTPVFRLSLPRKLERLEDVLDDLEERVLAAPPD